MPSSDPSLFKGVRSGARSKKENAATINKNVNDLVAKSREKNRRGMGPQGKVGTGRSFTDGGTFTTDVVTKNGKASTRTYFKEGYGIRTLPEVNYTPSNAAKDKKSQYPKSKAMGSYAANYFKKNSK